MRTNLMVLRKELGIEPEILAIKANIKAITYMHIERGRRTTYTTANAILSALNTLRVEKGLTEVKLEDLGISIA